MAADLSPSDCLSGRQTDAEKALPGALTEVFAKGFQDSFSWAGVGADFGTEISAQFGGGLTGRLAVGAASSIANAATRSALDGSNFGSNVIASIPDVIGQALGNAVGAKLAASLSAPSYLYASNHPTSVNGALFYSDDLPVDESGAIFTGLEGLNRAALFAGLSEELQLQVLGMQNDPSYLENYISLERVMAFKGDQQRQSIEAGAKDFLITQSIVDDYGPFLNGVRFGIGMAAVKAVNGVSHFLDHPVETITTMGKVFGDYSLSVNLGERNPALDLSFAMFKEAGLTVGTYNSLYAQDPDAAHFYAGSIAGGALFEIGAGAVPVSKFTLFGRGASNIGHIGPVNFAKSQQGVDPYIGIDKYRGIVLKEGTIIYGGTPSPSAFYTTKSAIERSGFDHRVLWDKLQVAPNKKFGHRMEITAYEVLADTPAAFGITRANINIGSGGYPQIVIENFYDVLSPIEKIPLK